MTEPQWVAVARQYLGLKEVPGPGNNPTIIKWLSNLGWSWLGGDSVPWCGSFLAECFRQSGITPPKAGYRALEWAKWGEPVKAQVGAVGVKSRKGGGHVFLIIGETPDKRYFKALGGNQNDGVTIIDILKADTVAIRWPAGVAEAAIMLPMMSFGMKGAREA